MIIDFRVKLIDFRNGEPFWTPRAQRDKLLLDENGEVRRDPQGLPLCAHEREDLTLRVASIEALSAIFPEDHGQSSTDKLERGLLAKRIATAGDVPVQLTVKEVNLVRERMAKIFNSAVLAAAEEHLDPKPALAAAPPPPTEGTN